MEFKTQPIYVDRSRYLDGQNCQRLRALTYETSNGPGQPRGWVPSKRRHYYEVGTTLHEALEKVIQGADPVVEAERIWSFTENPESLDWGQGESSLPPDLKAREAATWIEAAMWCFVIERLPYLKREFEVVAVERELEMPLGELPCNARHFEYGLSNVALPEIVYCIPEDAYTSSPDGELRRCPLCAGTGKRQVIWLSRPDLILRRRSDRSLFVMDFKSSGFKEDAASIDLTLQHKVLVYAQIAAVEHAMGEPVTGYLYEGFYKGQNREDKRLGFKRRYSPLAWAYCSPSDGLSRASIDAENWRLGTARLLKDLPGWSIRDYVTEVLTEEQRQGQLMYSAESIGANPAQVERWKKQVLAEEAKWQAWQSAGADLDALPQNDDHCMRYRGEPCSYLSACWDEAVRVDPVGSGKFCARTPNHPQEANSEQA